ncbi:cysteine--1-D-myo-inosityl 2-amino-2-deoxy-alpha-D-glucopyranoside ligase [Pseudactinotalea sp. HY158]|uniref:cysteine--1-D-myo-inosityl 2-amino-2-deoxy-alpha-D-glucopyranoside ligase n=1 Tax=Pseudactinotalea sp. HY158 TaxID=2654547 RepID=UPI00129C80A2|nr:cysteine--1-D-myo-inosityl 2-amino-2-deoxy-alpha-D-glucopyranoside ligase [Pseudactinotalea sp. HY158]QGH69158.1 cysteine--1-D-myo-inosityl 2-amino-2-deoxy-alpha-D-glucopyranoside ligase [Pseudactinotalea sp. HY158]
MHSWSRPEIPSLPGAGVIPTITDTATGRAIRAVSGSRENPTASMYVCGITPYDATHLGHAATYVAYDVLYRAWLDAGLEATYIQNVTDVDDPLLERAEALGIDWRELAESQTDLFRGDMDALRVIPPTELVGVVESMPLVVDGVTAMDDSAVAYPVGRDYYADLSVDAHYGEESGYDRATQLKLFAERGGDPDVPGKRDPLDPLLWRGRREGEPHWDGGVLGEGRPGWHVECAVIARKYLPVPFTVQGGGEDLIFPHHEMSTSHLRMLTGESEPAGLFMHTGLIAYQGEKMSKSLGNLVFVSELLSDGVPAPVIRLLLVGHHFRENWEYTAADLDVARDRWQAWREAAERPGGTGEAGGVVLTAMRAALADDLDTPAAVAAVDEWARAGGGDGRLVRDAVDALLGVSLDA